MPPRTPRCCAGWWPNITRSAITPTITRTSPRSPPRGSTGRSGAPSGSFTMRPGDGPRSCARPMARPMPRSAGRSGYRRSCGAATPSTGCTGTPAASGAACSSWPSAMPSSLSTTFARPPWTPCRRRSTASSGAATPWSRSLSSTGAGGCSPGTSTPGADTGHVKSPRRQAYALRAAALSAGALPVLAFPSAGLDWFAWVVLVPGLLIIRAAPGARAGAVRGWWFGAGYLMAALYWTVPNIGPGLLLVAVAFGALWAGWGLAAWRLRHRPVAALLVLPSIWVVIEYVRSWHALGGPWALLGASQWRHPVVLSLAALGGVWLVSFAIVAVNTAVLIALTRYRAAAPPRWALPLAVPLMIGLAAPSAYSLRGEPPRQRPFTVALVQPGVVHNPSARFDAGERITAGLPPVDLIVWGESSVGFDLDRRTDLIARLTALTARGDVLVNEDAKDVHGRISKSSILFGPDGEQGRYVKTRLVPFGEYIPFRPVLGWLTKISEAAGQNRVPGTGVRVLTAGGVPMGPLVCFESAFPDIGRAV